MRRILGLLAGGALAAACSSFQVIEPAPVGGSDGGIVTDGGSDAAARFCTGRTELCADLDDEGSYGSAPWSGTAFREQGEIGNEVPPGRLTRALHATLTKKDDRGGTYVQLSTLSVPKKVFVEADLLVEAPTKGLGEQVTLLSLHRGPAQTVSGGFLVEVNLTGIDATRGKLSLYVETTGNGQSTHENSYYAITYDRWVHVRLEADVGGVTAGPPGTARLQVTGAESSPPTPPQIDIARGFVNDDAALETGIGVFRNEGASPSVVEAWFDDVLEGAQP